MVIHKTREREGREHKLRIYRNYEAGQKRENKRRWERDTDSLWVLPHSATTPYLQPTRRSGTGACWRATWVSSSSTRPMNLHSWQRHSDLGLFIYQFLILQRKSVPPFIQKDVATVRGCATARGWVLRLSCAHAHNNIVNMLILNIYIHLVNPPCVSVLALARPLCTSK